MPDDLFADDLLELLDEAMDDADSTNRLLKTSLVTTMNVSRVPCKPHVDENFRRKFPQETARLENPKFGMESFVPEKMTSENCGSNKGWARILRSRYEEGQMHTDSAPKYDIVFCDVANFHRVIKVVWFVVSCVCHWWLVN